MTIALSTLLDGFNQFIEAVAVQSIADAGSDATKIVDSALSIYGDGYFNDWWIYVTSGNAEGDIRQVEAHTKADTTLDPFVDFSAVVAEGDTYELHKHNPDSVIASINDALVSIYPKLYKKIVFESLGLSLLTQNAASGQKDVVVADATLFFAGQEVKISDDNASEDATIASIDASTNTLTMEDNLANAYTTAANAKVTAKSGKYFNLGATIGNARVVWVGLKADSTSKRTAKLNCEVITASDGSRQLYFPNSHSVDDQTTIIEAKAKLEEVSAPTDTITLEDRRVKLLYCETAYHFYERQANNVSSGDWDRLKVLAASYKAKVFSDYRYLWMEQPVEQFDHNAYVD